MPVGITDLAHSLRKLTATSGAPIPLHRGQQLVSAALGHKTLASFQAALADGLELHDLEAAPHLVPDYELLAERAIELKVSNDPEELRTLLNRAFKERMPGTKVHASYDMLAGDFLEAVQHVVAHDNDVNDAMANANYDGVEEVYVETDLEPEKATVHEPYVENVTVQVTLGIDTERPYCGHQVRCHADVTSARLGRRIFDVPEIEVTGASLLDWGNSDGHDDEPPTMPLAEALALELKITPSEADELVDAWPMELSGSSGESFSGYEFDFTDHASPKLAAKLMALHGSLKLQVGPYFYESVRNPGI